MDMTGPKVVEPIGRKRYTLIVRDEYSRHTRVCFMPHVSDAAELFEQFPRGYTCRRCPFREVVIVRSECGGEFRGGILYNWIDGEVSSRHLRRPTVPHSMGVAEGALCLVKSAAIVGRFKASELFFQRVITGLLVVWAEESHGACDGSNRTAATAIPERTSQYETWHGIPPLVVVPPFLKHEYCKARRERMAQTKA